MRRTPAAGLTILFLLQAASTFATNRAGLGSVSASGVFDATRYTITAPRITVPTIVIPLNSFAPAKNPSGSATVDATVDASVEATALASGSATTRPSSPSNAPLAPAGQVIAVYVTEGQAIRRGARLALLDGRLLRLAYLRNIALRSQAQAQLLAVNSRIESIKHKQRQVEDGLDKIAENRRKLARGEQQLAAGRGKAATGLQQASAGAALIGSKLRPLLGRLGQLLSQLRRLTAQLQQAQLALAVLESKIPPPPAPTPPDLLKQIETLKAQIARLKAGIAQLQAGIARLRSGIGLLEGKLAAVKSGVGKARAALAMISAQEAKLAAAKIQLAKAEAQLKAAKEALAKARRLLATIRRLSIVNIRSTAIALHAARVEFSKRMVVAPANGVVTSVNTHVGELAFSNQPLVTISRLDPVKLVLYLPPDDARFVRVGQRAAIAIDTFSDRVFKASVKLVGNEVEEAPSDVTTDRVYLTDVQPVTLTVDNPDGILKPGQPADARIDLR